MASTAEYYRVEEILRPMHILKEVCEGFLTVSTTSTDLTKKGAFEWSDEAQGVFDKMKGVMSSCPILALPEFTQPFVSKCDASGVGIGAVLMQNNHSIAFESRKLRDYEKLYSIYDK